MQFNILRMINFLVLLSCLSLASADDITTTTTTTVNPSTTIIPTPEANSTSMDETFLNIFKDYPILMVSGLMFITTLLNTVIYYILPYIPILNRLPFNPYWREVKKMTADVLLPNEMRVIR